MCWSLSPLIFRDQNCQSKRLSSLLRRRALNGHSASAILDRRCTISRYEDYSQVSKYYDETRVPTGTEILIGALALLRKSRSETRLLDAGCGTGAYAQLALPYVDQIDAMA